jgi:hypothetical protein
MNISRDALGVVLAFLPLVDMLAVARSCKLGREAALSMRAREDSLVVSPEALHALRMEILNSTAKIHTTMRQTLTCCLYEINYMRLLVLCIVLLLSVFSTGADFA